jgi:predicted DNA-binding transcriptional regulator AlpA
VTTRLIKARPLEALLNVAPMTLNRIIAEERDGFPKPIYIGRHRYFDLEKVEAWLASRPTSPRKRAA